MLRAVGRFIWRFMIIFSFIVNIVLVIVLVALGILLFDIKNNIAEPLLTGLHATARGLDESTIDWTIPVRDTIPVRLNIPLEQNTTVVLTSDVGLNVTANIDLPGINAYGVAANVRLTLPQGLQLPVALDLDVPVDEEMDVALDVRAVIPLGETQLRDPIAALENTVGPLSALVWDLPSDFYDAGYRLNAALRGDTNDPSYDVDLLDEHRPVRGDFNGDGVEEVVYEEYDPWPGFSITAGLNYDLLNVAPPPEHVRLETGIVPPGGLPALDEQWRPDLYLGDISPWFVNEYAYAQLQAMGIPTYAYDGTMAGYYEEQQAMAASAQPSHETDDGGLGIVPTSP